MSLPGVLKVHPSSSTSVPWFTMTRVRVRSLRFSNVSQFFPTAHVYSIILCIFKSLLKHLFFIQKWKIKCICEWTLLFSSSVWLTGVSATISTGFYLLSKLRHVRRTKKGYLIKWAKITMWNCTYSSFLMSLVFTVGEIFKNAGLYYLCGHTQS